MELFTFLTVHGTAVTFGGTGRTDDERRREAYRLASEWMRAHPST